MTYCFWAPESSAFEICELPLHAPPLPQSLFVVAPVVVAITGAAASKCTLSSSDAPVCPPPHTHPPPRLLEERGSALAHSTAAWRESEDDAIGAGGLGGRGIILVMSAWIGWGPGPADEMAMPGIPLRLIFGQFCRAVLFGYTGHVPDFAASGRVPCEHLPRVTAISAPHFCSVNWGGAEFITVSYALGV